MLKRTGAGIGYVGFATFDLEPLRGLHLALTGEVLNRGKPNAEVLTVGVEAIWRAPAAVTPASVSGAPSTGSSCPTSICESTSCRASGGPRCSRASCTFICNPALHPVVN
jgi:hypothetical protein